MHDRKVCEPFQFKISQWLGRRRCRNGETNGNAAPFKDKNIKIFLLLQRKKKTKEASDSRPVESEYGKDIIGIGPEDQLSFTITFPLRDIPTRHVPCPVAFIVRLRLWQNMMCYGTSKCCAWLPMLCFIRQFCFCLMEWFEPMKMGK